jgi:MFS-type transporter involved in bile tolerance (Atg22 family)
MANLFATALIVAAISFSFFSVIYYSELNSPSKASSLQSYTACDCGCCGGAEPQVICIYHSKGDNLEKIIYQDELDANSTQCAFVGCGRGMQYIYCD